MRREVWWYIAGVTTLACLVYAFRPVEGIVWATFEPRITNAIQEAGFELRERSSRHADEVSLPWRVRLRARDSLARSRDALQIGFLNSVACFKLRASDDEPVECLARYVDGRAIMIEVRAQPAQASAARALRSALARKFPNLIIQQTNFP